MSLTLNMDFQFRTSVEKLWSALTDPVKLAQWIAKNDFKPVVGHRFQFRHEPNEYWDGVVDSEVLVVDEPKLLSFTWAVGEERHTVTLTVQDQGDGTVKLQLRQTGITNEYGLAGAKSGWKVWIDKLVKVLAE